MENSKKGFVRSSIAFKKPDILCEKLITTNYHKIIKNSRSKQNKNDLEHPFVDTVK